MTIKFFEGYSVNIAQSNNLIPEAKNQDSVLKTTHKFAIEVFSSLNQAFKNTKVMVCPAFKSVVIGLDAKNRLIKLPGSFFTLTFRTVCWIYLLSFNFFNSAFNQIVKSKDDQSVNLKLEPFISKGLDPSHFLIKNKEINVKEVPESVKVSDLLQIYDDINFDNPNQAGYLTPASRIDPDYNKPYSKSELKNHLIKFVNHVENRVAFLGTPSEYDIVGLNEYYSYLENVVRVCINKSNKQIEDFKHDKDLNNLNNEDKKNYSNLLENRARLAINLGIAGAHCGGRYSSESLELYDTFMRTENFTNSDLKECLNSILAQERTSIAREEIYRLFRNDTHGTAAYYQEFGEILGLPNTKGIVEHLKKINNRKECLLSFFKKYTDDHVVNVIYKAIEKDQILREKIQDWLKSEINDWAKEEYAQKASECINKIQAVLTSDDNKTVPNHLKTFASIFNLLSQDAKNKLKPYSNFDDFLGEFLAHEEVKQKSNLDTSRDLRKLYNLIPTFKEVLKKNICDKDSIEIECQEDIAVKLNKISDIEKIIRAYEINLDKEVLNRILEGKAKLTDVIESRFDNLRKDDFISKFKLQPLAYYEFEGEAISDEKLKQEKTKIIEWLLVKHGILKPQNSIFNSHKKIDLADRKKEILDIYLLRLLTRCDIDDNLKTKIKECFYDYVLNHKSLEQIELVASEILNEFNKIDNNDSSSKIECRRYRLVETTDFKRLQHIVFSKILIRVNANDIINILITRKEHKKYSLLISKVLFLRYLFVVESILDKIKAFTFLFVLCGIRTLYNFHLSLIEKSKILELIPAEIFDVFYFLKKVLNPYKFIVFICDFLFLKLGISFNTIPIWLRNSIALRTSINLFYTLVGWGPIDNDQFYANLVSNPLKEILKIFLEQLRILLVILNKNISNQLEDSAYQTWLALMLEN